MFTAIYMGKKRDVEQMTLQAKVLEIKSHGYASNKCSYIFRPNTLFTKQNGQLQSSSPKVHKSLTPPATTELSQPMTIDIISPLNMASSRRSPSAGTTAPFPSSQQCMNDHDYATSMSVHTPAMRPLGRLFVSLNVKIY